MKYSERLNGFWEEGYHYYIEIRDDEMTVRNYMRKVALKTHISYDADCLEAGERTVITVEDTVLSRDANGRPFTMIRELAYENGELKFLYYYTIMGETLYTLQKVDHGPFDDILIRDSEYLEQLQGEWETWPEGYGKGTLTIKDDRLTWLGAKDFPIHVISLKGSPDDVYIVPADLTESMFPGFNQITVLPDMLTTYMTICDMNVPMTVFARDGMFDKISIPDSAMGTPNNIMTCQPQISNWIMARFDNSAKDTARESKGTRPKFCPECGYRLTVSDGKFCTECGNKLPTE